MNKHRKRNKLASFLSLARHVHKEYYIVLLREALEQFPQLTEVRGYLGDEGYACHMTFD